MFNQSLRHGPRARVRRRMAGWLALLMLSGPACGLLTAAQAAPAAASYDATPGINSILLFPFANNAGAAAKAIGPQLDDAVRLRLSSVGSYKITSYTKFLAPVQRALADNVLTQDDLTKANSDPQTAGKIANQVSTDSYLIGAIESYTADPTTRKVTVEVSADLRSTQTGASLRTLAFTGAAAPTSNADTLDSVTQAAINSVASRVAASINSGRAEHTVLLNSQRGHSHAGETFLLVVLASALVYAVLHNSSNSNSSGGGSTTTTVSGGGGGGGGTPSGPPGPPSPP